MHAEGSSHVVTATVYLPGLTPSSGVVQGSRSVGGLHPLQLFIKKIQGFVPGQSYKAVVATLSAVAVLTILQPVDPGHGVSNAGRVVDNSHHALDHLSRVLVLLKRFDFSNLAAFHQCLDGAPV